MTIFENQEKKLYKTNMGFHVFNPWVNAVTATSVGEKQKKKKKKRHILRKILDISFLDNAVVIIPVET